MPADTNPRAAAAHAIAQVLRGRNLDEALAPVSAALSPADRSFARAMAYGVVREHRLLSEILSRLLEHPLKNEPEVNALLLAGLYQQRSMRVAPHAAVGE